MPGFDRTGPMGMGAMTGGGRGRCSPSGRWNFQSSFRRGLGRPRRSRRMARGFDTPGWMRPGPARTGMPSPMGREQEISFLKNQADALKDELGAIENRIREAESEAG